MRPYFKRHAPGILGFTFLILMKVLFLNRVSILKGRLIDSAIGEIAMSLSQVMLLFALSLLLYLGASYLLGIARYSVKTNIVKDLQDDFLALSLLRDRLSVRNLDVSKAVSSYTAEIGLINQRYLTVGGNLLEYVISITITIGSIAVIKPQMALITLLAYLLPIFFTKSRQEELSEAQNSFQAENDRHTDSFLQKLKGLEAIKNYHIEDKIQSLFNHSLDKLLGEDIKRAEIRARTNGMSSALAYVSQAVIAAASIYFVFKGRISAGDFVSIFALSSAISSQIYWLARNIESVLSAGPAVKSVTEYINFSKKKAESEKFAQVRDEYLALQIDGLSFSYGEGKILDGLDLRVRKGEKVLILGASGTGKSSLMSLITGYLSPDAGTIRLGSKNRAGFITIVEQEAFLFRGTVEDNLLQEDVKSQGTERFSSGKHSDNIDKLLDELGLSTLRKEGQEIEERGRNLSGGERKRLALARGFLKDTEILILDEPLANVDAENIERIEKLILGIEGRTVLMISHQVSDKLYKAMDSVYELSAGKLNPLKTKGA